MKLDGDTDIKLRYVPSFWLAVQSEDGLLSVNKTFKKLVRLLSTLQTNLITPSICSLTYILL